MAVGFYGYLFCVLCVSDLLNVASAVCQYMKQDIAFKVVKSDVVLSGTVNGITDGDSKYFPGIPGAKTIEMSIECIYKGPSMNSAVKIYGVGEFNNILSFKFRLSHLLQCIIFFSNPVYCILFKWHRKQGLSDLGWVFIIDQVWVETPIQSHFRKHSFISFLYSQNLNFYFCLDSHVSTVK